MSNKQGRIISIILISIAVSIMFVRKARADEIEDRCAYLGYLLLLTLY